VRFDLAAAGGFRVCAEHKDGMVVFVLLESRLGGPCRVVNPWPADVGSVCLDVTTRDANQPVQVSEATVGPDRILHWPTAAGHRYLLLPRETDLQAWKIISETPERRLAPRTLKQAALGRVRLF